MRYINTGHGDNMNTEKIKNIRESAHTLGADPNTAMILIRELCDAILESEVNPKKGKRR
jgi:hypothetical protein